METQKPPAKPTALAAAPARWSTTERLILMTILAVLAAWGAAIAAFGLPALVWPMKLVVPGAVLALILITRG